MSRSCRLPVFFMAKLLGCVVLKGEGNKREAFKKAHRTAQIRKTSTPVQSGGVGWLAGFECFLEVSPGWFAELQLPFQKNCLQSNRYNGLGLTVISPPMSGNFSLKPRGHRRKVAGVRGLRRPHQPRGGGGGRTQGAGVRGL